MKSSIYMMGFMGIFALGQAHAEPYSMNAFIHAENEVESLAACLVEVSDGGGAASCLCQAADNGFDFCDTIATGPDSFVAAAGIDFQAEKTKLKAKVKTFGSYNDIYIDVSASCTLQGANGTLEIDFGDDRTFADAGLMAQYAAVYMWPSVNGRAVGAPVRLCARGDANLVAAISKTDDILGEDIFASLDLKAQDLGGTYGFHWVAQDIRGRYSRNIVKMKFVVVAAVAGGLAELFPAENVKALGVLARAKLGDRAMKVTAENIVVVDADLPL